ncbi:hypothetical protein DEJ16_03545 [Curtobacterium sp. MCJR17_055]|uniref:DUF6177 family protein n=1 Tax=unclassified Curtobacterium TaxID=257496 RepID=UPI000D8D4EC0|nr:MULTISPECIES: DUF6177 family protein [unclassified Curtobacterium]PYY33785.1 hypothetical protein DEI87_11015 [Curtobacterium sp. MCBD17_029]PYY58745.1 hypothetical protein DEJ16_03545 [Curtobacterium sp. MCJR17_055]PYY59714.1 hypothetical protein DEJ26_07360 [Curtobacterium sp. MCPF17_015]
MVRHPLIDDVVGPAIVVDSSAPVVWLTESFDSLLRRASASGRTVVLRTGPEAALTPALRHALGTHGAAWAVRGSDGELRDGRTGVPAAGIEDFVEHGPELLGDPSPEHREARGSVRQISIDLTLRHHDERSVDVGSAIEALCAAVDTCPTRWGTSEPLTSAWDRWVVTQYAKHESPGISTSYAVGDGISATMTAHLTDGVVVETMSAVLTVPEGGTDPGLAGRLLDAVHRVASDVEPVFGVVMQRRGDADHLVRAVSYGEPEPLAVIVGPEATRFLDRRGEWPPVRTTTETFAGEVGEGLVVRFEDGWVALESFLDRIDEDRFLQLVGGAPLDPAHDDGALGAHAMQHGGQGSQGAA